MNYLFEKDGELLIKGFTSTRGGTPADEPGWTLIGTTEQTDTSILTLVEETDETGEVRLVAVIDPAKVLARLEHKQAAALNEAWATLRSTRNALLTSCDFAVLPDSPLGEEAQIAYLEYRQALRDLPKTTIDPLNPEWPKTP